MSDTLDENGLTLETLPELKSGLISDYKDIYGSDINVASDTPDGQTLAILAQIATDIREIIQNVYNSFDPDMASGSVLDQRCAINGIQRKSGTFTIVPVVVTTTKAVALIGLDGSSESVNNIPSGVFTIKDNSGNLFYLISSVTTETGPQSLSFRAANIGNVSVTAGTITTIATVTAGITSVINNAGVTQQGVDEETDANLRVRRQAAVGRTSQGYTDSLSTAISELDNVESVIVNENYTNSEDSNGIPAHSIWVVVQGGTDDDIAAAIYAKRPAGVGMKGDEEIYLMRENGFEIIIKFDRPVDVPLYIRFTMALSGSGIIDTAAIKTAIVDNISYNIGEGATTDVIVTFLKTLSNKYIITGCEISINDTDWFETIAVPSLKDKFTLSTANIDITT